MISVCMATYNGGHYILKQVDSILSQLNHDDELIISDDGSSDDTLILLEKYNDKRIKIFLNHGEKGYTNNFENALKNSRGDIIFISDQDDIWQENKVKICLEYLESSDFVVHDACVVNNDMEILRDSYFEFKHVKNGFLNNLYKINYLGCCMAFRRKVLDKALPFPKHKKAITHDSWLTLLSELYFKTSLIDQGLIYYRRHDSNTSLGGVSEGNSFTVKLNIRLISLWYLFKAFVR